MSTVENLKPGMLLCLKRSWRNYTYDIDLPPGAYVLLIDVKKKASYTGEGKFRFILYCLTGTQIKPFGLSAQYYEKVFHEHFTVIDLKKSNNFKEL